MSTSALPRGKTINVSMKDETVFGTSPSGNWLPTFIYSHDIEQKSPPEDDPLLGVARNNNRDTTDEAPGLSTTEGTIVAPVDLNHIGLFLKGVFGAAVVTGSEDPYTHVFTSGKEVIPYRSMEVKIADNLYMVYRGVFMNKLAFELGHAANYERFTATVIGHSELKNTTSSAGTPAAAWELARVARTLGVFKMDGAVAGQITGIRAEYDNKGVPLTYVDGGEYPSGIDLDAEATFTGSIDIRFKDATYYDLAKARTAFEGEMLWNLSADRSLSILSPALQLEPAGIKVAGPGGINQTFNFRGKQTADDPMITATLKSLVAAY